MIDLKRAIKDGGRVKFVYARTGNLWYTTDFGEEFPVPIEDMGEATFLAEDRAIMFTRYMRKWNQLIPS